MQLLWVILFSVSFSGCIIVREFSSNEEESPLRIRLSPMPELEMSELYVRSIPGDMVAFLPKDWFFINVEEKMSSDIIAVAVNQDYTLSAVFTEVKKNEQIDEIFSKQGLIGLARYSVEQNEKKSNDKVKLIGNLRTLVLGNNTFVQYEVSNNSGITSSKSVVYQSNLNNYYRFSLVPLNISTKEIPSAFESNKVFNSILATIKY